MRTGATQVSPTASPKVIVTVGTDTYYSEGGNSGVNERVVKVVSFEQIYGGQYQVLLDNSDETLNAKTYKGQVVILNFAFTTATGSSLSKLWVSEQRMISQGGKLLLQLDCIDKWGLLVQIQGATAGASWNQKWQEPTALALLELPESGELVPSDLVTDISAHYDKTIQEIVDGTMDDAFGGATDIDWDDIASDTSLNSASVKPPVYSPNPRDLIAQVLALSKSYLLWKADDKFHQITPDAHASVYTYNTGLYHFSTVGSGKLLIPNTVVVWYIDKVTDPDPADWTWKYKTASDAASVALVGAIDQHFDNDFDLLESLTAAEAQIKADDILAQWQMANATGQVIAPMHCSQELLDAVTIVDDRYTVPITITGYVFSILREYDRGVYRITLQLGGVATGYTPPGTMPLNVTKSPLAPSKPETIASIPPWSSIMPKAIQGYQHNIKFYSKDQTKIYWDDGTGAAATIKFYDGSTLSVSVKTTGSPLTLTGAGINYIYFDSRDASPLTLKVTTDYQSVMNEYMGLVAIAQAGSAAGVYAYIIPSYGKEPLINTDYILTGVIDASKIRVISESSEKVVLDSTGVHVNCELTGGGTLVELFYGVHSSFIYVDANGGLCFTSGNSLPTRVKFPCAEYSFCGIATTDASGDAQINFPASIAKATLNVVIQLTIGTIPYDVYADDYKVRIVSIDDDGTNYIHFHIKAVKQSYTIDDNGGHNHALTGYTDDATSPEPDTGHDHGLFYDATIVNADDHSHTMQLETTGVVCSVHWVAFVKPV